MNDKMNETPIWYCDICDEIFIIRSKSNHHTSKEHKHKEKYGLVAKDYESNNLDIHEID